MAGRVNQSLGSLILMNKWFENKSKSFWLVAYLFIAAKLCLHFFTSTNYELHRDEMLYFNMGDHLDWGYASVPPLIGFFAFLIKTIFGYTVFGIRLLPAILGAGAMYIMAKIIQKLGGGIFALFVALSCFVLSPGFLLFNSLFTPNVIEQFLWLLISWYLFKLTSTGQPKQWIGICFVVGIAFLNKYSVVFPVAGFMIGLFFSPYRKLFRSTYFIIGLLLAIAMILPNIYWQYTHNWPVVYHMKALKSTQLDNMRFVDFIVDVFSLNLLATFVLLIGLFILLFVKNESTPRYLGVSYLVTMLLFVFLGGKAYYILGLFPFLLAIGGYAMEKYLVDRYKIVCYSFLMSVVFVSLIALPYALPILSLDKLSWYANKTGRWLVYPFYRWEDGRVHAVSQIYADMTGWEELTGYVAGAYEQLSEEERKKCTIFAEKNYGYAGAIHFYGKPLGLPDAVTFLDSYVIWAPENIPEGPMIYINYDPADLNELYHSVIEKGCVNDPYFREKGLKVYLCTHPKTNVPDLYSQLVRKAKLVYKK